MCDNKLVHIKQKRGMNMAAVGLMFQVSAILRGTSYDRFRAWRRIVFEEYGNELTPETGMELSMCLPKVAVRRLCRMQGQPATPTYERKLLDHFNEYYFTYLDTEAHEELVLRRTSILTYAKKRGLCSCLIAPRFAGEIAPEYVDLFDHICRADYGENFYLQAAQEMGIAPKDAVLVLTDADDVDYARISGIQEMIEAEKFDG